MKKFLSALMAIVLAISTALAASAAFDSRTAENSTVEIPTLYFDSAEAYERHLNQLKSDVSTHANGNALSLQPLFEAEVVKTANYISSGMETLYIVHSGISK